MLRRDFIMVQIEELGKVITQIISQRNTGATRRIPEMIQVVYDSLRVDPEYLLKSSPQQIKEFLDSDDQGGFQRMEIAAKLLLEEAHINPDKQTEIRQKAKQMLEYIQAHDKTFSLERTHLLYELSNPGTFSFSDF
jgi:hypothetical protein